MDLGIINDNGLIIPCFLQYDIFDLCFLHLDSKYQNISQRMFEDFYLEDYMDSIYVEEEDLTCDLKTIPSKLDVIYCYINKRNYMYAIEAVKRCVADTYIFEYAKNIQNKPFIRELFDLLGGYSINTKVLNLIDYFYINYNKEHVYTIASKTIEYDYNWLIKEETSFTYKGSINLENGRKSATDSEREKFVADIRSKITEEDDDVICWIWKRTYARKIKLDKLPAIYDKSLPGEFNIQYIPFYCKKDKPEEYRFLDPFYFINVMMDINIDFYLDMVKQIVNELDIQDNATLYSYTTGCPILAILCEIARTIYCHEANIKEDSL